MQACKHCGKDYADASPRCPHCGLGAENEFVTGVMKTTDEPLGFRITPGILYSLLIFMALVLGMAVWAMMG